jgi:hypothetical protein
MGPVLDDRLLELERLGEQAWMEEVGASMPGDEYRTSRAMEAAAHTTAGTRG